MKSVYGQTHLKPVNGLAGRAVAIPDAPQKKKRKRRKILIHKKDDIFQDHEELGIVACSKCGLNFRSDRLAKHMLKIHCTVIIQPSTHNKP